MKSKLSAMMDGELEERELEETMRALAADDEARDTWRVYHLVGDALRDTPPLSGGFASRVQDRLEQEPVVLAPRALPSRKERYRWVALSAAASIAAIALVGSLAVVSRTAPEGAGPASVARATGAGPAAASTMPTRRVPLPRAADDYLAAHQAYSPGFALQGVAPYVTTVAESASEGKGR